jgi:hypothetical protein
MTITSEEARLIAESAVENVLLRLGIDPGDPDGMASIRDDLQFLQRMNRGAKEVKRATIKTCVGAVVTGGIAMVLIGLKDWFVK